MTRQLTDRNKLTAFQFSLSHTFNQKSKQKQKQKQKQEAMEIQSRKGSSKVRARNEKMSLEDYLDFVLSHKQIDLTANFLNQIISMHGFKKIRKVPKKVLTDAVHTLDLVDPSRSTLNDNVSCLAIVALEDVMSDLNDLNWQECCVTSIQTLNSWKHRGPPPPHPIKSTSGVSDVYGSTSSCVVGKLVPKRKRKRKRSNVVRGGADVGCSSASASASACVSLGSFGSS